jgi:carboxypeptidase Q
MRVRIFFLGWLVFCSVAVAQPDMEEQNSITKALVRTALTDQQGYQWLQDLCAIGPRLCGSTKSLQAIFWAKKLMQGFGADSVRLQPVLAPNWKRGNAERLLISRSSCCKKKNLAIAALGGSIGTGPAGITAPVLEVKSLAEVDSLGVKVQGKIVFYNRPFDPGRMNPNESYGQAVDQRGHGAARAGKHGAVAVLVRSVTSKYDNNPHTGVTYYEDGGIRIPAAAIGQIDADFLSAALLKDPKLELTIHLSCKPEPDTTSYNVLGEITGSEYPQEIILVGAHIDSWDLGCGAHDDGGGCVQAMEVLYLFKKLNIKPKRTIRCVLFIDEEQHQTGAAAYAAWSDSLKLNHLAVIESDRGVLTPRGFSVDADSLTLQKIQEWQNVLNLCGIDWVRKGGSGADVGKLKQAKARLGYVPDSQRYYDFHHSANDVLAEVHPRELELGTAAMATLVYLLSELGL